MTARTENLTAPLVSITNCLDAPTGDAACGPLIHGRTNFSNDWCERRRQLDRGEITQEDLLRGAVLDITVVPGADDVLWVEENGVGRLGGMVRSIPPHISTVPLSLIFASFASGG
jgi:hypothetical protein